MTYWIVFEISSHLTATPIIISGLRLCLVFRFESLKRRWMRRTLQESDVESIVRQRRYFGNKWIMVYFFLLIVVANMPRLLKLGADGKCVPEKDSFHERWRLGVWIVVGASLAFLMRKYTDGKLWTLTYAVSLLLSQQPWV